MGYNCLITTGIQPVCEDLRRIGGVDKRFWICNTDGINRSTGTEGFTFDSSGYVTAIAFNVYGGLHLFVGKKESHSNGSSEVDLAGANKFYKHDVTAKLFVTKPWDDATIRDLLVANVVIIMETNNSDFKIFGPYNGMDCKEQSQSSGVADASDTTMNLKFEGNEKYLPLRFFKTDYATTLALLTGYEV